MEQNRATILQTLQLSFEFNEAIVLRFTASEYDFSVSGNFPIKGKLFSKGEGWKIWRKKLTFGAGDLERRWETIKTHIWLAISCNESFFHISYLYFSHE